MTAAKPRRFDLSPDNFIGGVAGVLTASELGVLWALSLLVYSQGGPIQFDEQRLRAFLRNTHLKTIRAAISRLEQIGKIERNGSELMVKGCRSPIENARNRMAKAIENGSKGGRPSNKNNEIDKPKGFADENLFTTTTTTSTTKSSLRSDNGASQAKAPPKRERKVKAALPDDCPTEGDRETALRYWRDHGRTDLCARLGDEVEAFRAHHAAHGKRMADWSAAWRTWYGNAVKFNPKSENRNGTARASATDSHLAGIAELVLDGRREEPGAGRS